VSSDVLSAEDLLAGGSITHIIEVPAKILNPATSSEEKSTNQASIKTETKILKVTLRPLTISQIALISKAAKEERSLLPSLIIYESLVEPKLSIEQIKQIHLGLANFLISKITQISGMEVPEGFL
jgi:hypothetical protein